MKKIDIPKANSKNFNGDFDPVKLVNDINTLIEEFESIKDNSNKLSAKFNSDTNSINNSIQKINSDITSIKKDIITLFDKIKKLEK